MKERKIRGLTAEEIDQVSAGAKPTTTTYYGAGNSDQLFLTPRGNQTDNTTTVKVHNPGPA
jgi:hypothetical protein